MKKPSLTPHAALNAVPSPTNKKPLSPAKPAVRRATPTPKNKKPPAPTTPATRIVTPTPAKASLTPTTSKTVKHLKAEHEDAVQQRQPEPTAPSFQDVAARAYGLYEESGYVDGHEEEHWLAAEAELNLEKHCDGIFAAR